jgi:hypothetical protein
LTVKNDGAEGNILGGLGAVTAAFEEGGALRTVLVDATNGDVAFAASGSVHGDGPWIDDITSLQTYTILGDNAGISLGTIGRLGVAGDLETITINLTGDSYLNHQQIFADDSKIALVEITGSCSYREEIAVNKPYLTDTVNINVNAFDATRIEKLVITANEGTIFLDNQLYEVGDLIFQGTGDIAIRASSLLSTGDKGFVQMSAADASNHSGERIFVSELGDDVFYGSNEADTIILAASGFQFDTDIYNDAGGDDTINITGTSNVVINDG